jgi:hypothetical protein
MGSAVSIGNAGLLKLGASAITSLTDLSAEAKAINSCFERLRDAELRAHPWKFAIQRFSLGRLTEVPAFGYSFQYQLPATYLALVEIHDQWCWDDDWQSTYKIEGQKILTDITSPLKMRCVVRIDSPGLFDPLFDEVLSCRIATELAARIKQDDGSKDRLLRDYTMALREARRVDAIERSPEPLRDTSWITERYRGGRRLQF